MNRLETDLKFGFPFVRWSSMVLGGHLFQGCATGVPVEGIKATAKGEGTDRNG